MTHQPKSVGRVLVADFETLTPSICINSSQMCTYFCKDFVTGYCLYMVKNSISNRYSFSNRFHYSHLVKFMYSSLRCCKYSINYC